MLSSLLTETAPHGGCLCLGAQFDDIKIGCSGNHSQTVGRPRRAFKAVVVLPEDRLHISVRS